jgi:hypothetical protein
MQTAGKIVRIVFLVLAFVSYARPSLADPTFMEGCSDQCYGNIRWHQCSFVDDWDYPNGPENESTCWDSWGWDYWAVAYNYYWEYCRSQAGHEFFGYNFQSCQEEPTRGTFLCTWEDLDFCT